MRKVVRNPRLPLLSSLTFPSTYSSVIPGIFSNGPLPHFSECKIIVTRILRANCSCFSSQDPKCLNHLFFFSHGSFQKLHIYCWQRILSWVKFFKMLSKILKHRSKLSTVGHALWHSIHNVGIPHECQFESQQLCFQSSSLSQKAWATVNDMGVPYIELWVPGLWQLEEWNSR